MTIRIAVCDDDISTAESIEKLILNSAIYRQEKLEIDIFYSGQSFAKAIQPVCPFDLIFMDIEMSEMNGIQAGIVLREGIANEFVQLIYISSHEEYHVQLFDVQPSGFIKKPVQAELLEQKLASAVHKVLRIRSNHAPKLFPLCKKGLEILVPVRDILYLSSDRRKITVHTMDEQIEYYGTLSEEADKLSAAPFSRIHQSFLVNFMHLKRMSAKAIVMVNDEELPISERYYGDVKTSYLKFRGSLIAANFS